MFKKIRKLKEKIEQNIFLKVIICIVKIICWSILIIFLITILVQKFSNNNFAIGGYRIFNVSSGSMKPEYQVGDIIIDEESAPSDLKIGDNVTYLGSEGDFENTIVTHKIIDIRVDGDNYYYTTQGLANSIADPEISYNQIIGRVCYKTIILSFFSRAMTNTFIYYTICTLFGLITSYQIVKIVFEEKEHDGEEEEN